MRQEFRYPDCFGKKLFLQTHCVRTSKPTYRYSLGVATVLLVAPLTVHAGCSSAFCPVNTQWVQGVALRSGTQIDLRYEYLDQDQLRAGSEEITAGDIPADEHEIETETLNRNWLLSVNHAFNPSWGVSFTLPVVNRVHEHILNEGGEKITEKWNFTEISDARLLGRYQPENSNGGFLFGAKLPTGKTDVANAEGGIAERTLQPGSGTTDALIGIFYNNHSRGSLSSWFAQILWQQALKEHDDYKPGDQLTLDGGYRYDASSGLSFMVQLNAVVRSKDHGAEASDNSGGKYIFLNPGISYAMTPAVQIYGFFQQPLYQHVNGVQLTADNALVAGISTRF